MTTGTPEIQSWPAVLLRAVSSSFVLGSLNGFAQPLFSAAMVPFADPFDQRWLATLQSPAMSGQEMVGTDGRVLRASYREVEGRIAKMRGIGGWLRIFDPLNIRPQYDWQQIPATALWSGGRHWTDGRSWISGLLPPSVTVDAVAYTGVTSLVLRGLPASKTRVFRHGDRFEIMPNGQRAAFGHYYIVTEQSNSNADGKTRVYFEPGLRSGVNAGDAALLRRPTTVFSLIDDKQGAVSRSGNIGQFGFSLIEKLPADA